VLTPHYLEEADQLAKRVIVIDGRPGHRRRSSGRDQVQSRGQARPLHAPTSTRKISRASRERRHEQGPQRAAAPNSARGRFLEGAVPARIDISELECLGQISEDAFIALTTHPAKATR